MNTTGRHKPSPLRSRMVVRLWIIMMALVLFSVLFMWVVQIFLFERNYVDSAMADIQSRLEPVMEDLKTEDLAYNDRLIPYLSKSTSGKMMLVDSDGELIAMYSYGHRIDLDVAMKESVVWHNIKDSRDYEKVLSREQYKKVIQGDTGAVALEIGIPVTYDGRPSYVILYHSLDEVHTVLSMNRQRLVALSILLTLADSVEALGQALQRVDVLRKEVIANVSHELRSPLALIIGYSEMVRDISWKDDQARMENMNLIIREAQRMSEMVSDIMDYSQFQAGYVQLKRDRYNLYDIVESEVLHCEQSAEEYRITIRLDASVTDIPVLADALKISQVLRNLLYNAINHTDEGEAVSVVIGTQAGRACVSVINPGRPIPEHELPLIWERYHRSQHQGGRKQGTGLGLSIVSTILNAHHLKYGVNCSDGTIIFWFECPIAESPE